MFVPGGPPSANSTTPPTIDFLRKGTSTRLPGCTVPFKASGIAYVNAVRRGTGNATLQNGGVIPPCSVSARGNTAESAQGSMRFAEQNLPADDKNSQENGGDSKPLEPRNVLCP